MDKKAALIREKNLKKATTQRIEAIILSTKNITKINEHKVINESIVPKNYGFITNK